MDNITKIQVFEIALACACALICVLFLSRFLQNILAANKLKNELRNASGIAQATNGNFRVSGIANKVLVYITKICKRFEFSDYKYLISYKLSKRQELSTKIKRLARLSFLPTNLNNYLYHETQIRIAVIVGLIFLFIGIILSNVAGIIGLIAGCLCGILLPKWAMKKESDCRTSLVENSLSEMLEVVSLGLRSGLSFDRSLSLYKKHFSNELSEAFGTAMNKWNSGITTREEALREISSKYKCDQLKRVIENIIRSLRFGTSLASNLEDAAVDARNLYKTKREEAVAKAPVKMMIPTGTLILPAMLLLVLGPVLLELVGGF